MADSLTESMKSTGRFLLCFFFLLYHENEISCQIVYGWLFIFCAYIMCVCVCHI